MENEMKKTNLAGRKGSVALLLLAVAILAGAIVAGIVVSPELCSHYHLSCP